MAYMPYVHHIGRGFDHLGEYLSPPLPPVAARKRLVDFRVALRAGAPLHTLLPPKLQTWVITPGSPPWTFADHLNDDWFGASGKGAAYIPPTLKDPFQQTGWWFQWEGDANAILRETLLRAVEVALGINHNDPDTTTGPSGPVHSPSSITFIWTCGAPFFQGWLNWRDNAVTVVFTTPGNGKQLYATPRPTDRSPDYEEDTPAVPLDSAYRCGSWVIGQEFTQLFPSPTLVPQGLGQGFLPSSTSKIRTLGKIKVYKPSENDGGVLEIGRP